MGGALAWAVGWLVWEAPWEEWLRLLVLGLLCRVHLAISTPRVR